MSFAFAIVLAALALLLLAVVMGLAVEELARIDTDIPDDPHEAAAAWDEWHAEKETR